MKTNLFCPLFLSILLMAACNSSNIKENINKTGDAAGQAIGELATGISNGVKKSIEPKIEVAENLKSRGIAFGKMTIESDSADKSNVLVIYVIFEKEFDGQLTAKAFDNKDLEMGRVKQEVKGKKDETRFVVFHFDPRTDIRNDSRILLE